ncbi:MAG: hypothetical protein AABX30_03340 [Nanoarchaeota archaeon]
MKYAKSLRNLQGFLFTKQDAGFIKNFIFKKVEVSEISNLCTSRRFT